MLRASLARARSRARVFGFIWLSLLPCAGCRTAERSTPSASSSPATPSAPSAAADTTDSSPFSVALADLITHCRFNERHGLIKSCENDNYRRLIRRVQSGEALSTTLPALVNALESSDPKLRIVAARVAYGAFREGFGAGRGVVEKALAKRLIAIVPALPKPIVSAAIPLSVHAAMAAGVEAELYAMLDRLDRHQRASGYSKLAVEGGPKTLAKVTELLDDPDAHVAAAGVNNLQQLPAAERAAGSPACALALSHIADPRPLVALRLARVAVGCGAAGVDVVLTDLARRYKSKAVAEGFASAVDGLCHGPSATGTVAQCERLRRLLTQVASDREVAESARAVCLSQLGRQFPDAETVALLTTLAGQPSPRVATAATKALARLRKVEPRATTPKTAP